MDRHTAIELEGGWTVVWVRACAVEDLEPGEAIVVDVEPAVALFRVDDEWLATADACSHDESSLADGYVEGDRVECSWHFAKFCLRTGAVLSPPAVVGIPTYPTKVEDGNVYVDV